MKRRNFLTNLLALYLWTDYDRISRKIESDTANLKKFNHIKLLSLEDGFLFRTSNNPDVDEVHVQLGNPHNTHQRLNKTKIQNFMCRAARTNYSNYVFHVYDKWNRFRTMFACEQTVPTSYYHFKYYPWPDNPAAENVTITSNLSLKEYVITATNNTKVPDLSDIFANVLYIGDKFVNDNN